MRSGSKPWYKRWWGIILAIIVWPYFLIWFLWAKSKRRLPAKVIFTAMLVGFIYYSTWAFLEFSGFIGQTPMTDTSQASSTSTPDTTTTPAPTTQPQPTQKPAVSLDTLRAGAVAAFTPELTDLSNQMAQGQSLTNQSDTCTIGGAFNNWSQSEQHDQNVKNNDNVTAAYNKADNAYYDAHQTAPDALNNWDSDTGNVVSDITQWADAEETVCADQVSGDPALSSDQQTADKDYKQFQSDMAKAQADIKQI